MTRQLLSLRFRLCLLAILISAFSPTALWAHEDDEATSEELNAALELVFQQLQDDVWLEPGEVGTPNPDVGYFLVGEERVAFRKSAMSQAITGVLLAQSHAERSDCLIALPAGECPPPDSAQIEIKKNRILSKVLEILLAPYYLAKPFVLDPVGVGAGSVVRLTNEYGVTIFMFIIASQTAWEIVETIGVGPGHAACIAFNIALLAATRSAVDFGTMVCERGSGIPLTKRAAIGASSFRRTLTWGWQLARKILYNSGPSQITSRRADFTAQNSVPHSVLWQQAVQGGFFTSAFVATNFPEAGFSGAKVSEDIAFVYGDASPTDRWVVAHQHIAGLEYASEIVRRYMMARREEGALSGEAILKAQRALGRWGRNKNYYASLLRMGALDAEAASRARVNGLALADNRVRVNDRVRVMTEGSEGLLKDLSDIYLQIRANDGQELGRLAELIAMHRGGFKNCVRQLTM